MKALKIIGGLIGLLLLVFVILIFAAPKDFQVERTMLIEAPVATIFPHVVSLEKQQVWSPWAERDTNQVVTYSGEDSKVGSKSHWEGNKEVGVGEQTITAIVPNERIESELHFLEPWESKSEAYFDFEPVEGGTNVTWGFKGRFPVPMNAFMVFMNMEKALVNDFDTGLGKLKTLVESAPAPAPEGDGSVQVNKTEFGGQHYLAMRKKINMSEIAAHLGSSYGNIMGAMAASGIQMQGPPTGLYFDWDEETGMTELAAAIPVPAGEGAPDGIERIVIEPGTALSVDHYGAYDAVGPAHMAIEAWCKSEGVEQLAPAIEQYLSDPSTEADTSKWLTRITYLYNE